MRPHASLALSVLILAAAGPARADAVPDLDVARTCRSAQVAGGGVSDRASYEGCLRSEQEAKRQAQQNWGSYAEPAKRQCEAQFKAGGYPSYVEMITCLELASGTGSTKDAPTVGGPGPARDGKAERNGTSSLTREPPASQRTDPIEVLERK